VNGEWRKFLIHHSALIISSGYFQDFACFNAARANPLADGPALRTLHADFLQVGIETAPGAIVRMGDVITELRPFAADFASFCHDCLRNLQTVIKRAATIASSLR